jgi:hypothetical protein
VDFGSKNPKQTVEYSLFAFLAVTPVPFYVKIFEKSKGLFI